jgi:twitching motility protein PilT
LPTWRSTRAAWCWSPGPTGSGKSTTLAAMVNHLNENEYGHILTVEDPIEFVHESKKCLINQREVGPHTLSFQQRAALGAA